MLILYDFECHDCNYTQEALVERDTETIVCNECQGTMTRVITPIRFRLEGHTGHFPTAADKWARQHEKAGGVTPEE